MSPPPLPREVGEEHLKTVRGRWGGVEDDWFFSQDREGGQGEAEGCRKSFPHHRHLPRGQTEGLMLGAGTGAQNSKTKICHSQRASTLVTQKPETWGPLGFTAIKFQGSMVTLLLIYFILSV